MRSHLFPAVPLLFACAASSAALLLEPPTTTAATRPWLPEAGRKHEIGRTTRLSSSVPFDVEDDRELEDLKSDLVRICERTSPNPDEVATAVRELEERAEQVGIGQASSLSGFMSGEW